jgi:hypothetical protein
VPVPSDIPRGNMWARTEYDEETWGRRAGRSVPCAVCYAL